MNGSAVALPSLELWQAARGVWRSSGGYTPHPPDAMIHTHTVRLKHCHKPTRHSVLWLVAIFFGRTGSVRVGQPYVVQLMSWPYKTSGAEDDVMNVCSDDGTQFNGCML